LIWLHHILTDVALSGLLGFFNLEKLSFDFANSHDLKFMKKITFISLYLFFCQSIFAQTEIGDSTKSLIFSGNADIYYRFATNKSTSSTSPSFVQGFGLGWVNLGVEKKWKKWDLMLDVSAGRRTHDIYDNETDPTALSYIKQAYVAYSPTEKLTLTLGSMTSHFNYEYTEPFDNYIYTNSMVFTIIPGSYTGLKAQYVFSDKWKAMLGVFGDSNIKIDRNKGKHLGGQLVYTDGKFSFTTDFFTGKDGDTSNLFMSDFFAEYDFTEKFKLGLQYHVAKYNAVLTHEKTTWFGTDVYASYQMTDKFALGFRGERLNDADSFWFGEQDAKIWSWTLAGHYNITKNFKIVPELRHDSSNKSIFLHAENGFVKKEPSFLVAALYRF
jgi:hypothetical protein